MAELLLRRTQAPQVVPVFNRFIKEFPEPAILGKGSPRKIRRLLRPLGLRWRAENVVRLSQVFRRHGAEVLRIPELLANLPGVGDYVTAAVRCFAYGESVPAVDTNTARVVARLFGILPRPELRRNRKVRELLGRLVNDRRAREINLALIDLAASVCRPSIPLCSRCPLSEVCLRAGVKEWI